MQDVPWVQLIVGLLVAVMYLFIKIKAGSRRKTIKAAIDAGALVLDVRSPVEFAGGHYRSALNVPVDKLRAKLRSLGARDRTIVLYCASGSRSASAAGILQAEGFTSVINAGAYSSMPD